MLKRSIGSLVDQMMLSALNFGIGFFLIKNVAKSEYGLYVQLYLFGLLATTMMGAFLCNSFNIINNRPNNAHPPGLLPNTVWISQFIAAFATIIGTLQAIGLTWEIIEARDIVQFLAAYATYLYTQVVREFKRDIYYLTNRWKQALQMDIAYVICAAVLIFAMQHIGKLSVTVTFASLTISSAVSIFISSSISTQHNSLECSALKSLANNYWEISAWALSGSVLGWSVNSAYLFILGTLIGAGATAEVNAAKLVITPLLLSLVAWTQVSRADLTKLAQSGNQVTYKHFTKKSLLLLYAPITLFTPLLAVVYPWIESGFENQGYQHTGELIALWLVFAALAPLKTLGMGILIGFEAFKPLFKVSLTSLSIQILGVLIISHLLDYPYILLALISADILETSIMWFYLIPKYKIKLPEKLPASLNINTIEMRAMYSSKIGQPDFQSGLLLCIALIFSILPSGLNFYQSSIDPSELMEGSWFNRIQWSILFLWSLIMTRKVPNEFIRNHINSNLPLIILMAYCISSALWSDFPEIVLKRFVQFVGVLSICLLVSFYHANNLAKLLKAFVLVFFVLCTTSIIFAIAVPDIGIEDSWGIEGTWRGIIGTKNLLGILCSVSIYIVTYCMLQKSISLSIGFLTLLAAGVCLVMSRSSTSATTVIVSLTIYLFLSRDLFRTTYFLIRLSILISIISTASILVYYFVNSQMISVAVLLSPFAAIFGKSTDLTGRTDIWNLMWESISHRPYFGYGFSSFWLGPDGPSQYISVELQWPVPSAHNGYIDVINELGWIGFTLFSFVILHIIINLIELMRYNRNLAAFHAGILAMYLVNNFSESIALRVLFSLQFIMFFSMTMISVSLQSFRTAVAQQKAGVV